MGTPGVVIQEIGLPAATVRKSQTVPVFVGYFYSDSGSLIPSTNGCIRIDNSVALRQRFPNLMATTVKITGDTISLAQSEFQDSVQALLHYFDQGGGPCYVLSMTAPVVADFAKYIAPLDDVTLLAIAATSSNVQSAIDAQMQSLLNARKDLFYITHSGSAMGTPPAPPTLYKEQTAVYYPFLKVPAQHWRDDEHIPVTGLDAARTMAQLKTEAPELYAQADALIRAEYLEHPIIYVPPGPAVAAAYCQTDRTRGVWKAPANVVIGNATPYQIITDAEQGPLNEQGINIIRTIRGETTIWGARTCAVGSNEWRYIPVRRLFNQVERDVAEAMRAFVFEPNTRATWRRAKSAIDSYLYTLWQQGGLKGDKPDQGYQVNIDGTTMTQDDIDAGKMIIRIAMAAVRPAEFIVLQFTQEMAVA